MILAEGRIGIVDAALVRWLARQREKTDYLAVRVTESVFEPLLPKADIEAFLAAIEPVDQVLKDSEALPEGFLGRRGVQGGIKTLRWPEDQLLEYSMARICKRAVLFEERPPVEKWTSLDDLRARYGPAPGGRRTTVGMVSGSFDLIHLGHLCLMQVAKECADVLVVLAMSTASIRQQEKNRSGDRPVYSEGDRLEVLSALHPVDHIVMFDECDCRASLRAFCPDYFVKSTYDRLRPIVQEEAMIVESLGGKTIYPVHRYQGYSSTALIHDIRRE